MLRVPAFRLALCLGLLAALPAAAVTVDFDDRAGRGGPFSGACGTSFEVDDEYASLGVHFSSNDPTICVIAPGNAVSPPNVAVGMTGGNIDFFAPVEASFFDGATKQAVSVVILELTDTTQASATVEAYDENGAFLGASDNTGAGPHQLDFPRLIHTVRVFNGAISLDDFSFSPPGAPAPIPALPLAGVLALVALTLGVGAAVLRRPAHGASQALRPSR